MSTRPLSNWPQRACYLCPGGFKGAPSVQCLQEYITEPESHGGLTFTFSLLFSFFLSFFFSFLLHHFSSQLPSLKTASLASLDGTYPALLLTRSSLRASKPTTACIPPCVCPHITLCLLISALSCVQSKQSPLSTPQGVILAALLLPPLSRPHPMSRYHSQSNAPENAGTARRDDLIRQSPVEGSERESAHSSNAHEPQDDPESSGKSLHCFHLTLGELISFLSYHRQMIRISRSQLRLSIPMAPQEGQ